MSRRQRWSNVGWGAVRDFETDLERERESPWESSSEEGHSKRRRQTGGFMPCRCLVGYKTVVISSKITSWYGNMMMMGFDGSVVTVVMPVAPHIRSCSQTGLTSFQQFVHTYSALLSSCWRLDLNNIGEIHIVTIQFFLPLDKPISWFFDFRETQSLLHDAFLSEASL